MLAVFQRSPDFVALLKVPRFLVSFSISTTAAVCLVIQIHIHPYNENKQTHPQLLDNLFYL